MADLLLQLLLLGCGPALVAAYLAPGTWSDGSQNPRLSVAVAASAECGAASGTMNLNLTSAKPLSKLLLLSGDSTMCDFSEPATRGRTPTLHATTTLGGGHLRSATSFFLWASLFSEPMSACSAALALGGGGIVRRIASPQAPALSSALGGSLVRLSF
jgi:hypothetical protein